MTDNLLAQVGKSSKSDPNFSAHRPSTVIFFSPMQHMMILGDGSRTRIAHKRGEYKTTPYNNYRVDLRSKTNRE